MNAAVDSGFARTKISPVQIPRLTPPTAAGGALSQAAIVAAALLPTPSPPIEPKKTSIEMETHDFRSEARAERIFAMLNDNGSLDFVLTPTGGWVDNQYVSMLSAHSNYWDRKDFARFMIVETGREDGQTVEWLRVQRQLA
jgi:DDHD domain